MQLVFWDRTHHPGLEEGCPLPLQSPLSSPVSLQGTRDREMSDTDDYVHVSGKSEGRLLKVEVDVEAQTVTTSSNCISAAAGGGELRLCKRVI